MIINIKSLYELEAKMSNYSLRVKEEWSNFSQT